MSTKSADGYDVAIVGGGISGLYCGWRLLRANPKRRIIVYELTPRTGGRLLTWHPKPGGDPPLNAELGGMRFFAQQELVWSLVTKYFVPKGTLQPPIKFFVADPNLNNLWYLREKLLKVGDLSNPAQVPYRLDARGQYADPSAILNGIIIQILSANHEVVVKHLRGRTRPENWKDWDAIKPHLQYRGRRLWDVGFWNLLWDLLSPETYNFVTDAFGYYSITNNWNAAEAMQSVFTDFTQNPDYHTLREGYDHLPQLLREEFEEAGGEVRVNTPVLSIDGTKKAGYQLTIRTEDQVSEVHAKQVILAMPRRSLELLQETALWRLNGPLDTKNPKEKSLGEYIQSVIAYPAFKLFLVYKTRWWQQPPVSIAAGRTVSDMPIRQTYYFPPDPMPFPPGHPPADGDGLVMASYDDAGAVSFWQTLEGTQQQKDDSNQILEALFKKTPRHSNARIQKYRDETHEALVKDKGFYLAPVEMVRHAQEQLSVVHFNQPLPDPVTIPEHPEWFLAAYKDWSVDPFGGGWNFWAPLIDVKEVMRRIRQPFKNEEVYIVGEAYSGAQGWVEGALTTAEQVLRDHFHLKPESWQPNSYYLGY